MKADIMKWVAALFVAGSIALLIYGPWGKKP
jgi:hypothetical protein